MTSIIPSLHRPRAGTAIKPLRAIARPANATLLDRGGLLMLYRAIASQLAEGRPPILVVTSATHGEGVTTVAREFGQVVTGEVGQAVLLVTVAPEAEGPNGFEAVIEGAIPLDRAGEDAHRRVAIALDKFIRIENSLTSAEKLALKSWWDRRTPRERQLMMFALGS
jgi:hypothetical protein